MLVLFIVLGVLFAWFVLSTEAMAKAEAAATFQRDRKWRKEHYEGRFEWELCFIKPGVDPVRDRLLLEAAEKFDADPFQFHIFKEYDAHLAEHSGYNHQRAAACIAAGVAPF